MVRIHFTMEDLVRTRVGPTLGPLAETVSAFRTVQRRDGRSLFDGWRRQVRSAMPGGCRVLRQLIPGYGVPFDLDALVGRAPSLDEGVDRLRRAPRAHLRLEIEYIAGARAMPGWVNTIADQDARLIKEIAHAITEFHGVAFNGHWNHVNAYLDTAAARLGHILATQGVEALLATLSPYARWHAPTLDIAVAQPANNRTEVHLGGRGLVIIPSLFCWPRPIATLSPTDEDAPVILHTPVAHRFTQFAAAWQAEQAGTRTLQKLLGRTRAAVLGAIAAGPTTTTRLAGQLGISLATASEHATILRHAGLIACQRNRGAAFHTLTPLGAAVLNGQLPWEVLTCAELTSSAHGSIGPEFPIDLRGDPSKSP